MFMDKSEPVRMRVRELSFGGERDGVGEGGEKAVGGRLV